MHIIFRRIVPFFTRAMLFCLFFSFLTTLFDIYYSTKSPLFLDKPCIQVSNIKVWLYDFEGTEDESLREFAFVTMDIDAGKRKKKKIHFSFLISHFFVFKFFFFFLSSFFFFLELLIESILIYLSGYINF